MGAKTKIEADSLYAALARAQAVLSAPGKNREVSVRMKTGGTYKFKYATLDHLIEHVRGPLTENGLWFVQRTEPGTMVTRITHASGEYIESGVPMPNLPNAPQEAGSVLTYFRRYSLAVALGLASDEDDDANVAEGNGYQAQERAAPKKADAPRVTDEQVVRIQSLLQATGISPVQFSRIMQCKDVPDLAASRFDEAVERLENKLAEMAKAESNDKEKEAA